LKEKLRELREKKGLTQEKLAEQLGVGRTTVTLWERGDNKPRIDMLVSLANILGCKVDYLLRSKT
jgi:transcriptional regulator with XRE-family HTH domain